MPSPVEDDPFRRSMVTLFRSAVELEIPELALIYGCLAIRRGRELLDDQMVRLEKD